MRDRIVLRPDPAVVTEQTEGGIYLPTPTTNYPMIGTVLESGPGTIENGCFIPNIIRPGDRILYGKYSCDTIRIDGEELFLMSERDVKARVYDDVVLADSSDVGA